MKITNNLIQNIMPESLYTKKDIKTDNSSNNMDNANATYPLSFKGEKINNALKSRAISLNADYKKIQTFNVPYYNDGHMYQLSSGQKVIIIPKPGPTTINTYVKVGSLNEPDNVGGISHYIEHSLFNGSSKLKPNQFIENLSKMGAEYNASTGFNHTSYYVTTASKDRQDLEKIVDMHADMLQHPTFTPEMIEKEKHIVISEIKRGLDNPQRQAFDKLIRNLFDIKTEFDGQLTLGSQKNIENLTSEKTFEYFNNWYSPDNMTTVIVGDVKPDQAIKIVNKYFDKTVKSDNKTEKACKSLLPLQVSKREDIASAQVSTPIVYIGLAGAKNNDIKETLSTEALLTVLAGYKNARLTKALKPFNTDAFAQPMQVSPKLNDPQAILLGATFAPGDEEKGIEEIKKVIQEIVKNPPSDKEMEIVKNKMVDSISKTSEHSSTIAELVCDSIVQNGNFKYYTDAQKIINSLTAQDIQNAAKKYLDMNKASIVVVHPEAQDARVQNSAKSNIVSFTGKISANNDLAKITELDLQNNLHLILNDDSSAIRTSAIIKFETDKLPKIKPGVVQILENMLTKGTKNHDEEEMNDILDINCIDVEPSVGSNSIGVRIESLDKKFPLALDTAKEILLKADFTEEKFNKAKAEIKHELSSKTKSAVDRAKETLFNDHPMGNSDRVVLENIDKITLADVKNYYNYVIKNARAKAVITGQISKDNELKDKIINSLQTDLPNVQKYQFVDNMKSAQPDNTKVIAEADDRNQAHIVQMFKIKETGNIKDHVSLNVLNIILGGGMDSRIFSDLREKQGLAYEVGSGCSVNKNLGMLRLAIKTTTRDKENGQNIPKYENLKKSLDGFKKHINLLINEPVSKDELNNAKKYLKNMFVFETEASGQKTSMINAGFNTEYGKNYSEEYLKAIDEVTADDVQRVAGIHLTQPSVISVLASKDTIENTKEYLKSFGELKEY